MGTLPRKHILIVGLAALVFVLIGAIVGLIVTSAGGGRSGSVRNLTLQPNDLPPEFVRPCHRLQRPARLLELFIPFLFGKSVGAHFGGVHAGF